jgi:hypothetical protein
VEDASRIKSQEEKLMVEELEKEYAVLKDKVRELREYL